MLSTSTVTGLPPHLTSPNHFAEYHLVDSHSAQSHYAEPDLAVS